MTSFIIKAYITKDLPSQKNTLSTLYDSRKGKMWVHICPDPRLYVPLYGCV